MHSWPHRYALAVTGAYLLLAGCWILLSGTVAAGRSGSVEELARFELLKGIAFVVTTGAAIFAAAFWSLRRLDQHHAELARARDALISSERRALAGLLAASIAHDCNNLLVGVLSDLEELAADQPCEGPNAEAHARLRGAFGRMVELFRGLMSVGRESARVESAPLDVTAAVRGSIEMLRAQPRLKHCSLALEATAPVTVLGHPMLVDQIVMNLVLNAADATDGRGRISVRLWSEPGHAVLEVHDDGPGVPSELRDRLFSPFATTKPNGFGLGLISARGCAEAQGGRVEVTGSPLGGACFRVVLPAVEARAA